MGGAQVECGWTADGTIDFSTSTSNGVNTCAYNNCFVIKLGTTCADDDSKLLLNGCCAAPADCTGSSCGFKDTCENYAYSMSNVFGDDTKYCLTYHSSYSLENTFDTDDDVKNGDTDSPYLDVSNLYTYTPCEAVAASGTAGTVASSTNTARSQHMLSAAVAVVVAAAGWSVLAA